MRLKDDMISPTFDLPQNKNSKALDRDLQRKNNLEICELQKVYICNRILKEDFTT